jgi:hypothetical protein
MVVVGALPHAIPKGNMAFNCAEVDGDFKRRGRGGVFNAAHKVNSICK